MAPSGRWGPENRISAHIGDDTLFDEVRGVLHSLARHTDLPRGVDRVAECCSAFLGYMQRTSSGRVREVARGEKIAEALHADINEKLEQALGVLLDRFGNYTDQFADTVGPYVLIRGELTPEEVGEVLSLATVDQKWLIFDERGVELLDNSTPAGVVISRPLKGGKAVTSLCMPDSTLQRMLFQLSAREIEGRSPSPLLSFIESVIQGTEGITSRPKITRCEDVRELSLSVSTDIGRYRLNFAPGCGVLNATALAEA